MVKLVNQPVKHGQGLPGKDTMFFFCRWFFSNMAIFGIYSSTLNFWQVLVFIFWRVILDGIFAGEDKCGIIPLFFGCFQVVMIRRDAHGCKNAVK